MRISHIELEHLGQFKSLNFAMASKADADNYSDIRKLSNITVLIGNNGAGKTSVLKAIATALSWFIARLKNEKGNGSAIPEDVIMNGYNTASIKITIRDNAHKLRLTSLPPPDNEINDFTILYDWIITKTRKGRESTQKNNLQKASELASIFRKDLTENEDANLPLIAFYPVERVVLDIPLKIKSKHTFSQIDGYDNSLNQGIDFRRFFEWFREREDIENELKLAQLEKIKESGNLDSSFKFHSDIQLESVRNAISNFMTEFSDLKVKRKPKLHMSVKKRNSELNVSQLSQGEKSLMALVGDIARRLAMMNPSLENPLEGEGIILIDEIDMHLHPTWQRSIIHRLQTTFPNCQFILTTHSPLVISDSKGILVYSLENGEVNKIDPQYGQDVNSVLLDVMDTAIRNEEVNLRINKVLNLIQDNHFIVAKNLLNELENELSSNHIELIKAKLLLSKKKAIFNEKNK